jgi:hypothetical protein
MSVQSFDKLADKITDMIDTRYKDETLHTSNGNASCDFKVSVFYAAYIILLF